MTTAAALSRRATTTTTAGGHARALRIWQPDAMAQSLALAASGARFPARRCADEVLPGLWLGDARAAGDRALLSRLGVRRVVQALPGRPPFVGEREYLVVPAADEPSFDMRPHLEAARRFVDESLARRWPVLVHCHAGISRSATLVAYFLMRRFGWSAERAVAFVRSRRPVVRPNPGFAAQLRAAERP